MKTIRTIMRAFTLALIMISAVAFVSCNSNSNSNEQASVDFIVDGNVIESVILSDSADFDLPKMPQKDGLAFGGWYYDEGKWEKPLDVFNLPSESARVYARWFSDYEYDGALKYYVKEDDTYIVIIEPYEPIESITIPEERRGMPITEVGYVIGYDKTYVSSIAEIILPETLVKIGERSFSGFSSLREIEIPDSVMSIGDNAFFGCKSLTDVSCASTYLVSVWGNDWLGDSAPAISYRDNNKFIKTDEAFNYMVYAGEAYLVEYKLDSEEIVIPEIIEDKYYVTGLCVDFCKSEAKKITVSSRIKNIEGGAFSGCASLESITIPFMGSLEGDYENGFLGYIFGGKYSYENSNYVPESLLSVTVLRGEKIAENAFSECSSITDIALPEGLVSIEKSAFEGCAGITDVDFPDTLVSIGKAAFKGCVSLAAVELPLGVSAIGSEAFSNCSLLKTVKVPDGVTDIGFGAFSECDRLESIVIPYLNNKCFGYVFGGKYYESNSSVVPQSLRTVEIGKDERISSYAFDGCKKLERIILSENTESIGEYAFNGCSALASIHIPKMVETVKKNAFYGCTGLTCVDVSDIASWCGITFENEFSNPLYYAGRFYLNGTELSEITIPSGIWKINKYSFYACESLTNLIISSSVDEIDSYAFYGCANLTSVSLPDSFGYIGNYAFYDCTSIKSIRIPTGINEIGDYAFELCAALKCFGYCGNKTEWREVRVGANNDCLRNALHYYNEEQPINYGSFWHYDENGEIVIWQ